MSSGSAPTLVFLYHRVAHELPDPSSLQVSPDNFDAHLRWLRTRADVVPLEEIERASTGDRPRAAITLDDGYIDNLRVAKPILEQLGIPATVFITSGFVGDRAGFWHDRLADLLLKGEPASTHVEVEVADRSIWAHVGSPASRQRAHRVLHQALRRRPPTDIETALASLAAQVGRDPAVAASALPMTPSEVVELVTGTLVAVGAHSVSHAMLSSLDQAEQEFEIGESGRALSELVSVPVTSFAYPFGATSDYDTVSIATAERFYERAFTSEHGVVSRESDRFRLPRIGVGDWDVEQFAARVTPLLG